jgi:hypothetical protein
VSAGRGYYSINYVGSDVTGESPDLWFRKKAGVNECFLASLQNAKERVALAEQNHIEVLIQLIVKLALRHKIENTTKEAKRSSGMLVELRALSSRYLIAKAQRLFQRHNEVGRGHVFSMQITTSFSMQIPTGMGFNKVRAVSSPPH